MPELPEVETVRRGLLRGLVGRQVVSVKVLRSDSIGYPDPREFARQLSGHRFEDIARRGKYLLFHLDGGAGMGAHLRMSGRLILCRKKEASGSHLRVCINLDDGHDLRFHDMRVFGRLWYVPAGQTFVDVIPGLGTLGVEPLEELSAAHLASGFKDRQQCVKAALIDQSVVTGLGNIYVDESLFLAGIHPQRSIGALKTRELDRLVVTIKKVLSEAIELGGSTLRDYTDSRGVNGNYQHAAWVYGRGGQACRVCGCRVEKIRLAGRSSHFCPQCQPARSVPRRRRN